MKLIRDVHFPPSVNQLRLQPPGNNGVIPHHIPQVSQGQYNGRHTISFSIPSKPFSIISPCLLNNLHFNDSLLHNCSRSDSEILCERFTDLSTGQFAYNR